MLVTVGAGVPLEVTVNPLVSVPVWVSGLVTTTFHCPAAFPFKSNVQVNLDAETNVYEVAAISVSPVLVSFGTAPTTNPVPMRSVMLTVPLLLPVAGVILVTVGAGVLEVTVNPLGSVPVWESVLVTTTFHCPAVFPVKSTVQVIRVAETIVTPVAAISV